MRGVVLDALIHPVEGGSANDYEYCAGDPVNCTDLTGEKAYSYTYDLGRTGTPEELLSYAISNCSRAFPISGCTSGFQEGDELDLRKSFGIYVQSFPVRVTNITATSFSLVARDGHPEGRGRTITFTFYQEPGSFPEQASSVNVEKRQCASELVGPIERQLLGC